MGDPSEPLTLTEAQELRDQVRDALGRLDPESVPLPQATDLWEACNDLEHLASSAKTLLARRVDASNRWRARGFHSAAEFLAHKGGTTPADGRRTLDTSKRLHHLPATERAAREGRLSGPQLELVADGAAHNPAAEQTLLGTAGSGTLRDLRTAATRARHATEADPDAAERRIHARRSVTTWVGTDNTWNLRATGTAAMGARIEAALKPLTDQYFDRARNNGNREGHDAYAFDALVALAEQTHTPPPPDTGDDTGSSDDGDGACEGRATTRDPAIRYLTEIRVDLAALARGWLEPDAGETCEIVGVGPIPVARARATLGDALLKLVLTKGTEIRAIVPAGRGWTAAQRIAALWATNSHCSVAGCGQPRLQLDHRHEYAEGGPTHIDNADPLCPHHHKLKTHKHWALVAGTGQRAFVPPTDPRHPRYTRPPSGAPPGHNDTHPPPGHTPLPLPDTG